MLNDVLKMGLFTLYHHVTLYILVHVFVPNLCWLL